LLHDQGLTAAQMLVTLDDLEDRRRYLNAASTLDRLLSLGVVPVINENDSVATAEIRFGDNDRLAARIGQAADARGVILLSDIDGLYTANPHRDPHATLVPEVVRIDARIRAMADAGSASGMGSGGMVSKLEAARIAQRSGADLAIVSGKRDRPLSAFERDGHGTVFVGERIGGARKAWLAGRLTAKGRIIVDAGAVRALSQGRSLLPAGALSVEGRFARGDVVDVIGPEGHAVARGLVEYDAADAARIVGRRSDALERILGYAPRSALVHRDHMVLL
jgi:glutamate 5-kinase